MAIDRRKLLIGGGSALVGIANTRVAISDSSKAAIELPRERVLGIGGLFFRSPDPEALARWYQAHLGIDPVPVDYKHPVWQQAAGPTVFNPFPMNTQYFGSPKQAWMVNFRVRSLDMMVEQLRNSKIAVDVDPEKYPNGRFARLHDPDGNPIELWEPVIPS